MSQSAHSHAAVSEQPDAELLSLFAQTGSSEAFAAIVSKYSAVVFSACKRILGDATASEDAAQAAFLVLYRRAKSLSPKTVLSNWLYCTACHCARNYQRQAHRRAKRERESIRMSAANAASINWDEIRPELDNAMAGLPEAERQAVVVRYFEGLSAEAAAQRLGCAERTFRLHLQHGLDRLRMRLRSDGALTAVALAALLAQHGVQAAPSALTATITSACIGQAPLAAGASVCADGVLKAFALAKVKMAGLAVLALAAVSTSAVLLLSSPALPQPPATVPAAAAPKLTKWITGYFAAQNNNQKPADIAWQYYTHVIHFAAAPGPDGTLLDHYLSPQEIRELIAARPDDKRVLLAITDDAAGLNDATTAQNLTEFVRNIAAYVQRYGYDGVDLNWARNVKAEQYIALVRQLRQALGAAKLISLAATNVPEVIQVAAAVQAQVEQINVMCYDMDDEPYTWHNAALFQAGDQTKRTCDWRMKALLAGGVAREKLGLGLPFYGREWQNTSAPLQDMGQRLRFLPYHELIHDPRWEGERLSWDARHGAEYLSLVERNQFISLNGPRSFEAAIAWLDKERFGGIMVYMMDYEYDARAAGAARYPLSKLIYEGVRALEQDEPEPGTR